MFATRYVAPPMLGWKDIPVEILHPCEFYYELLKEGKIKIARKIKEPVTLQEPCNFVRRAGGAEKLQYLVNATCENFIEMYPNREHNFCCLAGGGVVAMGPPWKGVRMEGGRIKAEQLKATGAKVLIAPCHNCYTGMGHIIEHYNLGMKAKFMDEIITETMEIPEELKA